MDDYETPKDFYEDLNKEFDFNDDPCPHHGKGGLSRGWASRVFMNPPYSDPYPWVLKAYHHSLQGNLVVGLLRSDTSTRWFHEFVLGKAEIRFIKGRLKFGKDRAPFASILVIWRPRP